LILLVLLVAGSGYLWWRVRKEVRRPRREEPDDVA
jgi:hypothetical protein